MTTEDSRDGDKVKLSVEIQDLIEIVSKSGNRLSLSHSDDRRSSIEAEELKKAWFNHLLISLEKLHNAIEDVRRTDIPELRKELKEELAKIEKDLKEDIAKAESSFKAEVGRLEKLIIKNETNITEVSKTLIPLNDKVTELRTKMALIGVLAGSIGSLIFLIIKTLLAP